MSDIEDIIIRPISNPEADTLRKMEIGRAKDGRLPKSPCPHPASAVELYVDEEPGRAGRPTNLFHCGICKNLLFLVDAHGQTASDG